jgi:hypothetical protein
MQEVLTAARPRGSEAMPRPDPAGRRARKLPPGSALEDLGLDYVPVAALAKRAEEVYTPDRLEPLVLDMGSPALQALQKIRDEAHRFAITYHKKLRHRRAIASVLDQIPGVGPTLRTSLLKTLGSAKGVREASVADLDLVPKITPPAYIYVFPPRSGAGGTFPGRGLRETEPKEVTSNEDPHDGARDRGVRGGSGAGQPAPPP